MLPGKIAEALDRVQGTTEGAAAAAWKAAFIANVETLGGGYDEGARVRPQDKAAIEAMFQDVKTWVAGQYKGFPINVTSVFSMFKFTVTTDDNSITENATGDMSIGACLSG